MDVAASEFYRDGKYDLDFKSPDDPSRHITPDQLADLYKGFVKNYPGEFSVTAAVVNWGCVQPLLQETLRAPALLSLWGLRKVLGVGITHPDEILVLALC